MPNGVSWGILSWCAVVVSGICAADFAAADTYTPLELYSLPYPYILNKVTPDKHAIGANAQDAVHPYITDATGTQTTLVAGPSDGSAWIADGGGGSFVGGHYAGTYWNGTLTYLYHALLWSNNLQTQVDLHPTFAGPGESSYATGVFGSQQVGYESNVYGTSLHALLWHGTAASVIDLNPVGAINSEALGIGDGVQVGWQYLGVGNTAGEHATLWHGSAASAVDLNPTKLQVIASEAWGVGGDQQVGYGWAVYRNDHALLWNGTADSAIDLNPTNIHPFQQSYAVATNGSRQVGYGRYTETDNTRALVWNGSGNTAVDLQSLFSTSMHVVESEATSIDDNGNVFGWAFDASGRSHAVEWALSPQAVPLPSSLSLGLVVFGLAAIGKRCAARKPASAQGETKSF